MHTAVWIFLQLLTPADSGFVYCRAGWTSCWTEMCDWEMNWHLLATRLQGAGTVANSEISLWSSPFVLEGIYLTRLQNGNCIKAVHFHLPKVRKRERQDCGCASFPCNLSPFCEITIMPWKCWAASASQFSVLPLSVPWSMAHLL